jgi:hypothetical protein
MPSARARLIGLPPLPTSCKRMHVLFEGLPEVGI